MKLEVGKKYVVRDPKFTGIKWVRVDAIREELEDRGFGVVVTVHHMDGDYCSSTRYPDGKYYSSEECHGDLVAGYKEPELRLGPEHVGRRVKLRNGDVFLITSYIGSAGYPIGTSIGCVTTSGRYSMNDRLNNNDIVEVLL